MRERDEWDAGHIPGSVHVPYHDIHGLPDGTRPGAPGRGHLQLRAARGAPAASLLRRHGAREVLHVVDGGVPRWGREGGPIES